MINVVNFTTPCLLSARLSGNRVQRPLFLHARETSGRRCGAFRCPAEKWTARRFSWFASLPSGRVLIYRATACNAGAWNSSSFSRYVATLEEEDARRRGHVKETPEMAAILRVSHRGRVLHTNENRRFLKHPLKVCSLGLPFSYDAVSLGAQLSVMHVPKIKILHRV